MKYLGLILDGKLTWKKHILFWEAKLRKLNFLFYRPKNYFSVLHLRRIYFPLYESVLGYGIFHRGACKHIKQIKVLQNKVCRTILGHRTGTSEAAIYSEMKVARLEELHKVRLAMFVFKNKWLFHLQNTGLHTRAGCVTVAAHVAWKKEHSRMQARYKATWCLIASPLSVNRRKGCRAIKDLLRTIFLIEGFYNFYDFYNFYFCNFYNFYFCSSCFYLSIYILYL